MFTAASYILTLLNTLPNIVLVNKRLYYATMHSHGADKYTRLYYSQSLTIQSPFSFEVVAVTLWRIPG